MNSLFLLFLPFSCKQLFFGEFWMHLKSLEELLKLPNNCWVTLRRTWTFVHLREGKQTVSLHPCYGSSWWWCCALIARQTEKLDEAELEMKENNNTKQTRAGTLNKVSLSGLYPCSSEPGWRTKSADWWRTRRRTQRLIVTWILEPQMHATKGPKVSPLTSCRSHIMEICFVFRVSAVV